MFKTIVVALDGSDHAEKALNLAIDLSAKYAARLVLIHVLLRNADESEIERLASVEERDEVIRENADTVRKALAFASGVGGSYVPPDVPAALLQSVGVGLLDAAKRKAEENGVTDVDTFIEDGDAAKQILERAEEEAADAIVLGSRGLGDLKALLIGSVSHKVAQLAPCTCIAVK